ncbi:MAG TPA: hypothetical protein VNT99_08360 [Methylomirabilota bacterium]|nr:hypothetical protein [Methylomirabilota bacterium]
MIIFSTTFQEHPDGTLSVFNKVERKHSTKKEDDHALLFSQKFNAWFEKFGHEQLRKTGGHTVAVSEDKQHIITERIERLEKGKR